MAELINKKAFIEDIKTEIVNLGMDGLKGTPRDRSYLYEMIERINEQPTTTEAELRASVIDEFAESVITEMECFAREQEGEPNTGFIDSCVDIVRYAMQMKGEKE